MLQYNTLLIVQMLQILHYPDWIVLPKISIMIFSVAVIMLFLICWTPYHAQRIMFVVVTKTESWTKEIQRITEIIHAVSG